MVANVINLEKQTYDERVAQVALIDKYLSALSEYEESSFEEFKEAYVELDTLRTQIANSEKAYASYVVKLNEIKAFLNENPGLQGDERDVLDAYLYEELPAGDVYPNGSSLTILKDLVLDEKALQDETEFASQLLAITIERCYQAGSNISSFLVNADFSQPEAQGWTYGMGSYGGRATAPGMKTVITTQNSQLDIYQTVHDLRPGIYEVRISGYSEIEDASASCA